jgi:hypothetical protein
MSFLPRVTQKARELIAREFDSRGPDICMAEVIEHLKQRNPELLDMATKCAVDLGNPTKVMVGFSMFYRLLIGQFPAVADARMLVPVPRITVETRALLVTAIDEKGSHAFTMEAIDELEKTNPELLQMAHNCASELGNYLHAMQGFALLYKSLLIQSRAERTRLH